VPPIHPPQGLITRRMLLRSAAIGVAGAAGSALIGCRDAPRPDGFSQDHADAGEGLEKTTLRIGYLPITDATPLVLAHGLGYYAEAGLSASAPTLFRGWSQIAEAFQARQLDVVHLLMPMAIWLRFGQQVPLKLVAWNHTGGSALTVSDTVQDVADLAGTTVAIPFWYSIHNVVLQMLIRDAGLTVVTTGDPSRGQREVKLVVMSPPDMPPALANGAIAGFIVADPFNAVAEVNRVGRILRFIPDVWFEHACCVVIMHEDDVQQRPRYTQAVVNSLVRAQLYAREHRVEAARLLSSEGHKYLPQPRPVIERALTHYDLEEYAPTGAIRHEDWQTDRIDFQPFPQASYTEELVRQLRETVVEGDASFLQDLDPAEAHRLLVDDRFARVAIDAAGGPEAFGIDPSFQRVERIAR
jgi:NitT/TauT family transport system substrate-binding protein